MKEQGRCDTERAILRDLARVEAMWFSDLCKLWFSRNRSRCWLMVDNLASRGLVVVRRSAAGSGRLRYVVVVTQDGLAEAGVRPASRLVPVAVQAKADLASLYAQLVLDGLPRKDLLVGADLRKQPGLVGKVIGVKAGAETAVLTTRASREGPGPSRKRGVNLWIILTRGNQTWSWWVRALVRRQVTLPVWVPKPSWSPARAVALFRNPSAVIEEVREALRDRNTGLVLCEDGLWCSFLGERYRLLDFRPVPVHWIGLLARGPQEVKRALQCAGVVAVVESDSDAARVTSYASPGAPCLFLVLRSSGAVLLREGPGGLVRVG